MSIRSTLESLPPAAISAQPVERDERVLDEHTYCPSFELLDQALARNQPIIHPQGDRCEPAAHKRHHAGQPGHGVKADDGVGAEVLGHGPVSMEESAHQRSGAPEVVPDVRRLAVENLLGILESGVSSTQPTSSPCLRTAMLTLESISSVHESGDK